MKHTIMMIDRESDTEATYNNVIGYDVDCGGCILVLKLDNGETASFDKDNWLMFDLTPMKGWNSRACEIGR